MYEINIKQSLKNWNENNPTLRKKTLSTLAEEVGITKQAISQLGKRHNKSFNLHFAVIFSSNNIDIIKNTWKQYLELDIILFNRLEKICNILECEIYDIVKKIKKS